MSEDELKTQILNQEKRINIHAERIRALEVHQQNFILRLDHFEEYCKQSQALNRETFNALNNRIERFITNEVHDLEEAIKDAKNTQRAPLSRQDWVKIITAVITVSGGIIVALIQAGII